MSIIPAWGGVGNGVAVDKRQEDLQTSHQPSLTAGAQAHIQGVWLTHTHLQTYTKELHGLASLGRADLQCGTTGRREMLRSEASSHRNNQFRAMSDGLCR